MKVHVLQHVPFEGLGSIEPWLAARGATVGQLGIQKNCGFMMGPGGCNGGDDVIGHGMQIASGGAQPEPPRKIVQIAAVHAQFAGGCGPVAAVLGYRPKNEASLKFFHLLAKGSPRRNQGVFCRRYRRSSVLSGLHIRGQMKKRDNNRLAARDLGTRLEDRSREDVFELPDVARPVTAFQ